MWLVQLESYSSAVPAACTDSATTNATPDVKTSNDYGNHQQSKSRVR